MDAPAGASLAGDDAAGPKLDVVGMRPEGEERREVQGNGFGHEQKGRAGW